MKKFTILLPIVRPPYLLPKAIERVLAQTVDEFELIVLCDGASPETIECGHEFARRDSRVNVRSFPKGARHGEAHRHTVLMEASSEFVAYLEDDDLWFPNHLEELEKLLLATDFGNTIHVAARPNGSIEAQPCDIGNRAFRQRFLNDVFNRFGYSFCGHRLDAYRRLPEGWAPAPYGIYNDLHMWRKFLCVDDFRFGTRMVITAIALPDHYREHMTPNERIRESDVWITRITDEHERAKIIESAWCSVVGKEIQSEQEIIDVKSSNRQAKVALSKMEAMHPGSLQRLELPVAVEVNAQIELERLAITHDLAQQALSILTNESKAQLAANSARQTEIADLNVSLAEALTAGERATAKEMETKLELERLTTEMDVQLAKLSAYETELAMLNGHLAEALTAGERATAEGMETKLELEHLTTDMDAQLAALSTCEAELAMLNGRLIERMAAYEMIIRSRSWRFTRPLRSAVAAVRHLKQMLAGGKS